MIYDENRNPVKETKQLFKVKHHDHFAWKYHTSICQECNFKIKDTIRIPVFLHNSNYDKYIFKSLIYYDNVKKSIYYQATKKLQMFYS